MIPVRSILIITTLLLTVSTATPQVALNGIANHAPYMGLQPELIDGVTALPAIREPLVRHIWMVDTDLLGIAIDERAILLDNIKPYEKQRRDRISMEGYHGYSRVLIRKGKKIGYICGTDQNWLRRFNEISGDKLLTTPLSDPCNYKIIPENGQDTLIPKAVYRKSYPIDRTHTSLAQEYPLRHEFYLQLPEKLKPGTQYIMHLETQSQLPSHLSFTFDDTRLRSEAIHVNLDGYAPGDPKVGYLSTWLGDGGSQTYNEPPAFSLVDDATGETVYTSSATLRSPGTSAEYMLNGTGYNHNLTDIMALDFSDFNLSGKYRIVVDGIGTSFPFRISSDVWEESVRLVMKGFLHQRSGIELGPPYTDYQRPRNMHPADHTTIHKVDTERFFNPPGQVDERSQTGVFERIQASILTDTEIPGAWGGWMDAGDFDQRMTHLWTVRRMILLHDLNPEYFRQLNLGIPESSNKLPDILDEAAWCLDLYRRTQGVYEKGGVSWWVESEQHPRGGEPSWLNSLPTALVPPTPSANFLYAATAAQLSLAIQPYDTALSSTYLASALDAFLWAITNDDTPDLYRSRSKEVYASMAMLNLYRRTGASKWHDRYLESLVQATGSPEKIKLNGGNYEAIVPYLLDDPIPKDSLLLGRLKRAMILYANDLVTGASQNAYRILKPSAQPLNRMATLSDMILPLVMAHKISGDPVYTDALAQTLQYTMGANPMNRSYISGLGERWFVPYQLDWETNHTDIPAGIPTFGPVSHNEERWGWTGKWAIDAIEGAGLYPGELGTWPHAEKCFNQTWIAPINEFTVRSPMGELLLCTAYLAQDHAGRYNKAKMSEVNRE